MLKETMIRRCDKTAFVSICALIYFLPISIALVEWFVALPVLCFCIKKLIEVVFRIYEAGKNKVRKDKIRYCLKGFLPVNNFLAASVMAYAVVCFLSIFVSSYPQLSTRAFFGKILERVFLFFVFVESVNTEKRIKRFSLPHGLYIFPFLSWNIPFLHFSLYFIHLFLAVLNYFLIFYSIHFYFLDYF